jgi:hypothetical protein
VRCADSAPQRPHGLPASPLRPQRPSPRPPASRPSCLRPRRPQRLGTGAAAPAGPRRAPALSLLRFGPAALACTRRGGGGVTAQWTPSRHGGETAPGPVALQFPDRRATWRASGSRAVRSSLRRNAQTASDRRPARPREPQADAAPGDGEHSRRGPRRPRAGGRRRQGRSPARVGSGSATVCAWPLPGSWQLALSERRISGARRNLQRNPLRRKWLMSGASSFVHNPG